MKQALIFLILLIFKNAAGQNIFPNGSFEDVNICPEFHQPCSPSGWFYINHLVRGYFKSDIKPIGGDKDLNLVVVDTASSNRDYWQTMLLCPLEVGKNYKVSLKLASNYIGPNLHDIGLYFTDSFLFFSKDSVIQPGYYLNFLDARIKMLKNGWFEIHKEFTATSANHFLIIGNFSDKTNKQIKKEREISIRWLYLSVDDLTITSTKGVPYPDMKKIKDSLYSIKERHFTKPQIHDSLVTKPEPPAQEKIDTIIINNIEFDLGYWTDWSNSDDDAWREFVASPRVCAYFDALVAEVEAQREHLRRHGSPLDQQQLAQWDASRHPMQGERGDTQAIARNLMAMVGVLYDRGHQHLTFLPHIGGAGSYRYLLTVEDPPRFPRGDVDPEVVTTVWDSLAGGGVGWVEDPLASPVELAEAFLARYPRIARLSVGERPDVARWVSGR